MIEPGMKRPGTKMNTKELLEKRRALKNKKPVFTRQDAHKKKKVGWKWRRPKGSDSKMRVGRKGYKRCVRKGWGSPSLVRGLDRTGFKPVMVSSAKDFDGIDSKAEVAVISSGVGTKKRFEIIEKALGANIMISNYKDPKGFVEGAKKGIEDKKKEKEKLKEARKKRREDAKKDAEKKAKEEKKKAVDKKSEGKEEMTEEEKKMEEKKKRDKLLISTE